VSSALQPGSARATALADRLREAAASAIAVVEHIEPERWVRVPAPGVWSVGKDAEHAAEGAARHQWIVRLTIGERVSSSPPAVERKQLFSALSPRDAADLLRQRADAGVRLVEGLTDAQLDLPKRPPGTRQQSLAETIEGALIGHLHHHRDEIEAKLAGRPGAGTPRQRRARVASGHW
jgi:uncharacterized damage-inducible protein DinB